MLVYTVVFSIALAISSIHAEHCARLGRHLLQHQCVLTPEATEGPFYLPYHLLRNDIREDREGVLLKLRLTVTDVTKCQPMRNTTIDIWQADATGLYSSYMEKSPEITSRPKRFRPAPRHATPTDNSTFLRGVQITDHEGKVEFITIFPGRYAFRTAHIHLEAHVNGNVVHVAQLYFPNSLIRHVYRLSPYNERVKNVETINENDYIFTTGNGEQTTIQNLKPLDNRRISNGILGEMILGIDPNKQSTKLLPS